MGVFAYSQNSDYPYTKKTECVYTIQKIIEQQQLDNLQSDLQKVKGISDIKFICKWESGKGQLILSVSENITGTENIENFDMSVIKQLILKNDLEFVDFITK